MSNSGVESKIVHQFTLGSSSAVRIDHWAEATQAGYGLGSALGISGVSEKYTVVEITKLA